jgi:aspartate aminotransferase-like enzyme
LQEVHRTQGDVMVWSGSGSAGWEAALTNSCLPGDRVVATVTGDFGRRFADVAERLGLIVTRVEVPWGTAVSGEQVAAAIEDAGDVRAVLVTHNETSTGVTNPLQAIASVANDAGAMVLVDAVSSAAAMPLETDAWGLDWVISGSQKAWMCPPGLMIAAVSDRALAAADEAGYRRFFFDVRTMAKGFRTGQAPTTPAIPLLRALEVSLGMMQEEGIERMWERHAQLGEYLREAVRGIGLRLYADPAFASASLTAIRPPDGMAASELQNLIREDSGIEVAIGQGPEAEAVIRIGHMGWTHEPEIEATVESLARVVHNR